MVSEKKTFIFSHNKSMGDEPRGVTNLDLRDIIGRIYVGYH